MTTLEEGVGDSVRPKNKFESQDNNYCIQDSCKSRIDVRCRYVHPTYHVIHSQPVYLPPPADVCRYHAQPSGCGLT